VYRIFVQFCLRQLVFNLIVNLNEFNKVGEAQPLSAFSRCSCQDGIYNIEMELKFQINM